MLISYLHVSIRRADVWAFEQGFIRRALAVAAWVSIRRADVWAFELGQAEDIARRRVQVSIRRADVWAFEPKSLIACSYIFMKFQSAGRMFGLLNEYMD